MNATKPSERLSARDRLLAAAEELFYEEGVNTVGIDRVIERAGVAKASLYAAFGSKEELIRAYLRARHEARVARITAAIARHGSPRDRLLAVFDDLGEAARRTGFRGCAFVRASAEAKPGGGVMGECDVSRAWMRKLLTDLARDAGARDPDTFARQLQLLYDGVSIAGQMDRDLGAAATARAAAAAMLDEATKR
jgi:AcrR family transcriptional regulator